MKDEDFCVPEAEEVIEDDNRAEVAEPVEDLVLPGGLIAESVRWRKTVCASGGSIGKY